MPNYKSNLQVNFNKILDARLQRVDVLPDPNSLTEKQDAWIFIAVIKGEAIAYFFDFPTRTLVPLNGTPPPDRVNEFVGDGAAKVFRITHNLGWNINAQVFELGEKRSRVNSQKVDCDIFRESENVLRLEFGEAPRVDQFEVVIK